MPHRYQAKLTLKAADHLQEIFDYIQRNSPQNADRITRRLLDGVDSLEHFPYRYKKLLKSKATFGVEIRSMPVPPYLIRYCIDDANQVVTVLSIRHGARRAGI